MTALTQRLARHPTAASLALALSVASPTWAQVAFVPIDVMGTAMSGAIMDAARDDANDTGSTSARTRGSAPSRAARLAYAPSAARTRANIAGFVEKSRAVDPQGASAIEQKFSSATVMDQLETGLRPLGLTRTNVADAYALWWTVAWKATQGRNENLPREQMQAVKRQATDALLAAPGVAAMTDAQKQEFAESLLVQAMLIDASVDMALEQTALMEPLKAAVAKGAKASGLDLSEMTLTPRGFRAVER